MILGGLQKTTLIDFPGKIAATVFTSGCNFFCGWCYSSELVLPEKIKTHPVYPEADFFKFLENKKGLLDGVVICGGEPTLQKDLPEFIKSIKKMGFLVKLDTNGSNPVMLQNLINGNLLDYVAMDIKTSKDKYFQVLKGLVKIEDIQKSIDILKAEKIGYEFRTTVVPTVHEKEDFIKIADWIGGAGVKYYLQRFRPEKTIDKKFESLRPYSEDWYTNAQKAIEEKFKICLIRG